MTKKFSKLLCRAIIASVSFAMLLSTVPWACASALSENSIKQSAGTATGYGIKFSRTNNLLAESTSNQFYQSYRPPLFQLFDLNLITIPQT